MIWKRTSVIPLLNVFKIENNIWMHSVVFASRIHFV